MRSVASLRPVEPRAPQGYRAPGLIPRFWEIAAHHRFVFFSGVPTVYSALLQHPPQGQDLSELKYGVCGAAPMPVELFHRFQKETGVRSSKAMA